MVKAYHVIQTLKRNKAI